MKLAKKPRARQAGAQRVAKAGLIAIFALVAGRLVGTDHAKTLSTMPGPPFYVNTATDASGSPCCEQNYLLDFAGDHSLNAATVTEQAVEGRTKYTVDLHLASGAQQSVVVAGPPGGLQIQMQDMTGDDVPNDVILRPALLSRLSAVLVNDGHDHFTVVGASASTGSLSSSENLGSRRQRNQAFALLRSTGFKSIYFPARKRILVSQLRYPFLYSFGHSFARIAKRGSRPERAPPVPTLI